MMLARLAWLLSRAAGWFRSGRLAIWSLRLTDRVERAMDARREAAFGTFDPWWDG